MLPLLEAIDVNALPLDPVVKMMAAGISAIFVFLCGVVVYLIRSHKADILRLSSERAADAIKYAASAERLAARMSAALEEKNKFVESLRAQIGAQYAEMNAASKLAAESYGRTSRALEDGNALAAKTASALERTAEALERINNPR
jgi:hypothetical protein